MLAKFIVCHGVECYKDSYRLPNDEPVHEYTLMTERIISFGKLECLNFHTWLISRDTFKDKVTELWLEETPEQIRFMMKRTIWDMLLLR